MKEYVRIYTGSAILVKRLADLLDQNNIPSLIKDNQESGRVAGFGTMENDVDLHVFESDYENAEKIKHAYLEENNL